MGIFATIREGLRIARTSRSLWLFGFFIGAGSSGGGDDGMAPVGGISADGSFLPQFALVAVIVAAFLAFQVLCEGALIEGVRRAHRNEVLRVGEGIREGAAHWKTIFAIDVIYLVATLATIVLLVAPCVIAVRLVGLVPAVVILGIPAVLIGIPALVTFYIWEAFAKRIAVFEDRRAIDAIHKARLFLHGRLWHGLKLMIASLLGTIFATLVAILAIAPFVLAGIAIFRIGAGMPGVILGLPVVIAAIVVAVAIIGTFRSSVWTIGYLTEVEAGS